MQRRSNRRAGPQDPPCSAPPSQSYVGRVRRTRRVHGLSGVPAMMALEDTHVFHRRPRVQAQSSSLGRGFSPAARRIANRAASARPGSCTATSFAPTAITRCASSATALNATAGARGCCPQCRRARFRILRLYAPHRASGGTPPSDAGVREKSCCGRMTAPAISAPA